MSSKTMIATGGDLVRRFQSASGFDSIHPRGRTCSLCKGDLMAVGLAQIVYTFETCSCAGADFAHLQEQMWHRECFANA